MVTQGKTTSLPAQSIRPAAGMYSLFPTSRRKLLLLNEMSSITFVDEEAVYQTERAALLYYKMNGYASVKAITSCGGYVQEVLFLRADHIVFGADVVKHMVGYGPGWAEKVRNLSYAFRGPTWVRLETQEDVMEEEQAGKAAEACMHGALIHLGCVELERRVIKNRAQTRLSY